MELQGLGPSPGHFCNYWELPEKAQKQLENDKKKNEDYYTRTETAIFSADQIHFILKSLPQLAQNLFRDSEGELLTGANFLINQMNLNIFNYYNILLQHGLNHQYQIKNTDLNNTK